MLIALAAIGCHSQSAPQPPAPAPPKPATAAPLRWWCHEGGEVFRSTCVRSVDDCNEYLPQAERCTGQARAACFHVQDTSFTAVVEQLKREHPELAGKLHEVPSGAPEERCAATITACRYQRSSAVAWPGNVVLDECRLVE